MIIENVHFFLVKLSTKRADSTMPIIEKKNQNMIERHQWYLIIIHIPNMAMAMFQAMNTIKASVFFMFFYIFCPDYPYKGKFYIADVLLND
jgi:hypothetical protein